ncbi:peptidoglycan editing factor PgeF [Clostridium fermenticellae]|uniref:Purine nucleoside phosphorylase n=1 Tax=Clostridium fermenticellae TaxID=2068654 RepID=A0A386H2W1_9CLOT|nr:peptidoglycan editing factor PgeF [Clostridium fermenticellae]AYD39994.1 peptidoglycan editing factor PgeF [Clostridium fermenticellae]
MKDFMVDGYKFIKVPFEGAEMVFSTAYNNLDFDRKKEVGMENIQNIKKWFDVNEVGFLSQIHSDKIINYDGKKHEADALITDKKNIAIGVFTADCVPVLLYDTEKHVSAAVHSGWRGTFSCIVYKTIEKMKNEYNCTCNNIAAVIGPHIHQCCYEVSDELIEKFVNNPMYKGVDIHDGRYLSMQNCIIHQLKLEDVKDIRNLDICTFCSKEYETHSYRKNQDGRMFSFIFLK